MSACIHAMVEGVNAKLAEIGEVAWPNEKVASEVCFAISQSLEGPDQLPAGGLAKESAVMIANILKEANEQLIRDGGLDEGSARGYLAKTASDVRDIRALASDVAGRCMLKAAEDTLTHEPGDSGDNTLAAAAAAGDVLAKLDLKNRPAGSYQAGLGNTSMPEDVGQVGTVMSHPGAPNMGDVPNSLDIKMAALADLIENIKVAKAGDATDKLNDVLNRGKEIGRRAGSAAKEVGEKAKSSAKGHVGKALAIGGGIAAARHFSKKKSKEKADAEEKVASRTDAVGRAVATALGLSRKLASHEKVAMIKQASDADFIMLGFLKCAAEHYCKDGLGQLKVANPSDLDPEQLRALADYIEQNISAEGNNIDLGQLDPETLAALHAQGGESMDDGGAPEGTPPQAEPDGDEPPQELPPQMKGASVLAQIKRAAEGGMAGETSENTLANASDHDPVARLDKKNRPEGSYNAGQGKSTFPNEGQIGHSEVIEQRESPQNTMTSELKSASLSQSEKAYVERVSKMASIYGDQLPATLNKIEKIAAYKHLADLPPSERTGFIAALRL